MLKKIKEEKITNQKNQNTKVKVHAQV